MPLYKYIPYHPPPSARWIPQKGQIEPEGISLLATFEVDCLAGQNWLCEYPIENLIGTDARSYLFPIKILLSLTRRAVFRCEWRLQLGSLYKTVHIEILLSLLEFPWYEFPIDFLLAFYNQWIFPFGWEGNESLYYSGSFPIEVLQSTAVSGESLNVNWELKATKDQNSFPIDILLSLSRLSQRINPEYRLGIDRRGLFRVDIRKIVEGFLTTFHSSHEYRVGKNWETPFDFHIITKQNGIIEVSWGGTLLVIRQYSIPLAFDLFLAEGQIIRIPGVGVFVKIPHTTIYIEV